MVATSVDGKIIVASVIETASKISLVSSVPVADQVSAMRFSADDSKLLAIVGDEAVLLNSDSGKAISKTRLTRFSQQSDSTSVDISPDLSTLFVARDGVIDSISLVDVSSGQQYWPSVPVDLVSVVSENETLLGLGSGSPSHAELFSIAVAGRVVRDVPGVAVDVEDEAVESNLLDGGAVNEDDLRPHELARSPRFAGSILAIQTLSENRIAFLANENGQSKIGIAKWKGGWAVKSLKLDD